ncbi:GntR family transcriptional regulator [Streptacidiphilus sp. 4-A2]|nr:GntR family transcriptional regulator [Streptacidiphilus sp. 4-A2]
MHAALQQQRRGDPRGSGDPRRGADPRRRAHGLTRSVHSGACRRPGVVTAPKTRWDKGFGAVRLAGTITVNSAQSSRVRASSRGRAAVPVGDRDPSRADAGRAPGRPGRPSARSQPQPVLQRPVQRSSLREQVSGALREEMMAGRLPAGTHFTVKEIAELYGVSATPVREALLDLAAQDLLWIEHNRGFTVPQLSWADYLDVIEARTLVTDGMLRRISVRPKHVEWSRMPSLQRRADAAARAARSGHLDVLVGCDRRFWGELALLLGNPKLANYLDWLRVQYWIFAAPHLRRRTDIAAFCWAGHLELTERIRANDWPSVHRRLIDYNRQSVEQMAALCGEYLEADEVAVFLGGFFEGGGYPDSAGFTDFTGRRAHRARRTDGARESRRRGRGHRPGRRGAAAAAAARASPGQPSASASLSVQASAPPSVVSSPPVGRAAVLSPSVPPLAGRTVH